MSDPSKRVPDEDELPKWAENVAAGLIVATLAVGLVAAIVVMVVGLIVLVRAAL